MSRSAPARLALVSRGSYAPSLPFVERRQMNESFFTIQINELRALRPPLDELMSSLPRGFHTLVTWILFGPDGNYQWEYHDDPERAKYYLRDHICEVSKHLVDYWERQYYSPDYGTFQGSANDRPYDKIVEYFDYVIEYIASFIDSHLSHLCVRNFLRVTSFEIKQSYIVVYHRTN